MRLFRECFRHMNVTTLTDITNAAGTHLVRGVRHLGGPAHPSIYHFHVNPLTITESHRTIWREFLNTLTSNTQDKLITPLGAWTTTPSTIRPYRLAGGSFFHQHSNDQWYRHQLSDTQRSTRTTFRRYSSSVYYQQDLPSHNTIVDADNRGVIYMWQLFRWVTRTSIIIIIQEPPPLRAQRVIRETSQLS